MSIAKASGGFVALYRKLLDHPLVNQLPAAWFRVFIVILLKANWKAGTWWDGTREITIPAGSFVTSIEKLSKLAGASKRQTRGALAYLDTTHTVTSKTTNRYTIVSVVNYEIYQKFSDDEGTPDDTPDGKETTHARHADGTRDDNNRTNNQNQGIREPETKNPSSSSSEHSGSRKEQPDVTALTTTKEPLSSNYKTTQKRWTPDDERIAAGLLVENRGDWSDLPDPDLGVVLAILPYMDSIEDFRLWLSASQGILKTARTWGRYVNHAKRWPEQRAHALAHLQDAVVEKAPDSPRRPHPAIQYETPEERDARITREDAAVRALKQPDPEPACGACHGYGVIGELAQARCCECPEGKTDKAKRTVEQQLYAWKVRNKVPA